jgi:hypothetical protein
MQSFETRCLFRFT